MNEAAANQPADIIEEKGTKSPVLRTLAKIVSYLFHPIFMPLVMTYFLTILDPTSFVDYEGKQLTLLFVTVGGQTLFFPLLVVLLLKGVGFINSIFLRTQRERIIPLIATMIFYWWASRVAIGQHYPEILQILLRGAYWGVILLFLLNIFFKVSMHTTAAGGMLGIFFVLLLMSPIEMSIPLFIAVVIAGVIGTARMLLGVHNAAQIWVGYVLGVLVQLAAYWYVT